MSHGVCHSGLLASIIHTRCPGTDNPMPASIIGPQCRKVSCIIVIYPINTRVNKHILRCRISECDRIVMMGWCLWCSVMLSRRQGETDRYRARDMRHTKSHNNSTLQTKTSPPHNLETPRPLAMEAEQEQRICFFLLIISKMDGWWATVFFLSVYFDCTHMLRSKSVFC